MIRTTYDYIKDANYLQNKSFNRLRTALNSIDTIEDSVAYNVVDSVIFIKNPRKLERRSGYKAIYNTVLINTGEEEIKVRLGAKQKELCNYDDSQDFGIAKADTLHCINPNEVMIIETMEPYVVDEFSQLIVAYVSKYNGIK